MDAGTRFLLLSLVGELYAIPIAKLLEITVSRGILKDPNLTEIFEGKFEYRGKQIPVLNVKKVFKMPGGPGTTLLVIMTSKGILGLIVDAVTEILDTDRKPVPVPLGVMNPSFRFYNGILRHKDALVLLLNEDGLLP